METFCPSTDSFNNEEKAFGCQWTGQLQLRNVHYATDCEFYIGKCPNDGCGGEIQRRFLSSHQETCIHRRVSCEFCGTRNSQLYSVPDLVEHKKVCEFRLVACECSALVPFKERDQHVLSDCPITIVPCPLAEMGVCGAECPKTMRRGEVREHLVGSDSLLQTILNVAQPFTKLQVEVNQLAEQQTQTAIASATVAETSERMVADFRQEVATLRAENAQLSDTVDLLVKSIDSQFSAAKNSNSSFARQMLTRLSAVEKQMATRPGDSACGGEPSTSVESDEVLTSASDVKTDLSSAPPVAWSGSADQGHK